MEGVHALTTLVEAFTMVKAVPLIWNAPYKRNREIQTSATSLCLSILGSIMWYAVRSRPDLGFSLG
jgi:hypothetical protein